MNIAHIERVRWILPKLKGSDYCPYWKRNEYCPYWKRQMNIPHVESVRWILPMLNSSWEGFFEIPCYRPSTSIWLLLQFNIYLVFAIIHQLDWVIENLFNRENHLLTVYSYYYWVFISIVAVWWLWLTLSKWSGVSVFLFQCLSVSDHSFS